MMPPRFLSPFHSSLEVSSLLYLSYVCTLHSRLCVEQGVCYKHLTFYIECEKLLRLYLGYGCITRQIRIHDTPLVLS